MRLTYRRRRAIRSAVALVAVAAAAYTAAARPLGVYPWHLNGNDFLAHVSGSSGADQPGTGKWHESADVAYRRVYAEGYQAGVVDATQGKVWCATPGMKPGEVDDRIWGELRQRAGKMPGSAADELVRLYAAHFPCPDRR